MTAHASNANTIGTFMVAWNSGSLYGGQAGIFAQRYLGSGAPLGGEFRVNSSTALVGLAGLDHDLQGDFVIAWTADIGPNADVRLRRLCASLAGDADGNGAIDVGDVFYVINALFAGGPSPVRNADANGDGVVNVADVFYLINFLFAGGPAPSCPNSLF